MRDKRESRYVILDERGTCRAVRDNRTEETPGLPALLAEGWAPVRETPFPAQGTGTPCILILLERDGTGAGSEFGFA